MRKVWIGTAIYLTVVASVIGAAAVALNAAVGVPTKGASKEVVARLEPIQRTSGKWTPVEIKREPAAPVAPPLPLYVSPRLAAANTAPAIKQPQIMIAERKPAKKVVIVRRGNLPEERYTVAAYAPEQPRFFGPFRFPF